MTPVNKVFRRALSEHHGQSPVPVLRVALVSGEMLMIDLRELGHPSQVLDCQGR